MLVELYLHIYYFLRPDINFSLTSYLSAKKLFSYKSKYFQLINAKLTVEVLFEKSKQRSIYWQVMFALLMK